MRFNQKNKTIFVDLHSDNFDIDEKVDIVLSPTLYWVKKVSLPVKSVREVIKLLPSVFEESIPNGNYNYYAYKSGDEFIAFAYDDKFILDTLTQKGINSSNIGKIYFAQSELSYIDGALKINEEQSVYVKDGILILVPCCWIDEVGELDVSDLKHSKHNIALAQFDHIVDKKSLFKINAILLAFIVLLSGELFVTTQKVDEVTKAKDELFSKYSLKPTMFQNKSILKKHQSTHKKQTKIRQYTQSILSLRLGKGVKLTNINLKSKDLVAIFSGLDKGSEKSIVKNLKKKNVDFKSSFKDGKFYVEMKL
jgi:hypothetical protein